MNRALPKISEREKDVMAVLWRYGKNLTASDISKKGNKLSINTVQVALRNLMKKEYIKVADIVYSGTVLTRSYVPIISAEQYAANQLQALRLNSLNFSTLNFIDHLPKDDKSEILNDLENIIKQKKQEGGE